MRRLTLLAIVMAWTSAGVSFEGIFPGIKYPVGHIPVSIALGDMNGDGLLDVVTLNPGSGDVSILLNTRAGFAEEERFPVGDGPFPDCCGCTFTAAGARSLALGDIDGDGRFDVITANPESNDISVLVALPEGGFASQARFPAGGKPVSVALGDLNGDGRLDVVTTNAEADDVSVLIALPEGGFAQERRYPVHHIPKAAAIRDIDGDGLPDIVTANHGDDDDDEGAGDVSVLIALPEGGYRERDRCLVGEKPTDVAIGDLNSDGLLDIVTATAWGVYILLANPEGGFDEEQNPEGIWGVSIALSDLDGDNLLDIVTAGYAISGICVFLGQPAGSFSPHGQYNVGSRPYSVAAGDLNGDGLMDIVTANTGSDDVSAMIARPGARFMAQEFFPADGGAFYVKLGDFNNDSRLDIASGGISGNYVSVLLASPSGGFQEQKKYPVWGVGEGYYFMDVGDMNNDGLLDIVASHSWMISVLTGNAAGEFEMTRQHNMFRTCNSIALADMSGDSFLDVVTVHPGKVSVLLNLPDGAFQELGSYEAGELPSSVAVGDINADGLPDMVTANVQSDGVGDDVSVLFGMLEGGFSPQQRYAVGGGPSSVALGDINADGLLDIATANFDDNTVSLLVALKEGGFAKQEFPAGVQPVSLALGDVNGDGLLDAVTANWDQDDDISLLLGQEAGGFARQQEYAAGFEARSVAIGDLNSDGLNDVAIANYGFVDYPSNVSVLYNLGAGTAFIRGDSNGDIQVDIADAVNTLIYLFAHGTRPACIDSADANDDGKVDISDAITVLRHLFEDAGPLPEPFGACGVDRTADELSCASYPPCT